MLFADAGTVILQDVVFEDNVTDATDDYSTGNTARGGIAHLDAEVLSIDGLTMLRNEYEAGAISAGRDGRYGAHVYGGILYLRASEADFVARHLDLRDNYAVAAWMEGRTLYVAATEGQTNEITNFVIAGNRGWADHSGWSSSNDLRGGIVHLAAYSSRYNSTMTNGDIYGNRAGVDSAGVGDVYGGIVSLGNCGTNSGVKLRNVNLVGNTVSYSSGYIGLIVYAERGCERTEYSNQYNAEDDTSGCYYEADYAVDPGYTDVTSSDPAAWDLHLGPYSTLTDAGDGSMVDADGTDAAVGAYGGPSGDW